MIYRLASLLLGPVFLVQGMWVRRVTPRLPEPEGARAGVWGHGPDLRLLILGDSAAAGVGVQTQAEALSGRVVASLGEFYRVTWKVQAASGNDSAEVLAQLQDTPAEVFDVVVISVGVNDVTSRTSYAQWRDNVSTMIGLLEQKFSARLILFSSLPPLHFFPVLPQPLRWWMGGMASRLNQRTERFIADHPCCQFVDVRFPLNTGYMAEDGFHPGPAAYALWGEQLAKVIRSEMEGCQRGYPVM